MLCQKAPARFPRAAPASGCGAPVFGPGTFRSRTYVQFDEYAERWRKLAPTVRLAQLDVSLGGEGTTNAIACGFLFGQLLSNAMV